MDKKDWYVVRAESDYYPSDMRELAQRRTADLLTYIKWEKLPILLESAYLMGITDAAHALEEKRY